MTMLPIPQAADRATGYAEQHTALSFRLDPLSPSDADNANLPFGASRGKEGTTYVLLIAESQQRCQHLVRRLEQHGCQWRFASTTQEVQGLVYQSSPQLVLSMRPVTHGSALMEALTGFAANVFYSFPIEDSCLWMQAIRDGQACLKPSMLRRSEFASALDEMLRSFAEEDPRI